MKPLPPYDSTVCCRELKPGVDRQNHTFEDHVEVIEMKYPLTRLSIDIMKDKVFVPGPNRIFVFGSNYAGIHGAGAAKTALGHFGAEWGKGEGIQNSNYALVGGSYAIPTKDSHLGTLSLNDINRHVDLFLGFARKHPELYFFVTRIGCGLAGYTDDQIAPLFKGAPENCELPEGWRLATAPLS